MIRGRAGKVPRIWKDALNKLAQVFEWDAGDPEDLWDLSNEGQRATWVYSVLSDLFETLGVEDQAKKLIELRTTLDSETDRGCALMVAAYLDTELEGLLRARLVDDKSVLDSLMESPFGTFSSRIDYAYCLGLVSKSVRRDLHLLRKIRNDFAHSPSKITLARFSGKLSAERGG